MSEPTDVDGRNDERADAAEAALDTYCALTRQKDFEECAAEEVISDLLGDVRHLLDRTEGESGPLSADDFDSLSAHGRMHYDAETGRTRY